MQEYHELAIFFDLKKTSRRGYAAEAWEIFVKNCDCGLLKGSQLFHGEVTGLIHGLEHMFCICARTRDLDAIQYLKNVFAACDDERLAPPLDRVRESDIISKHQLSCRGRIDSKGRLKTEKWTRTDHDLCKAVGWSYVPRDYPKHLSAKLVDELEKMSEPGFASPPGEATEALKPAPKRSGKGARRRFMTAVSKYRAVIVLAVLVTVSWLTWDAGLKYLREGKEALGTWFELGWEASSKRREGYAVASITRIPPDLDLRELNEKLETKDYVVHPCRNESLVDVWTDCTVWFAIDEIRDPLLRTNAQAFVKIDMRSLDGQPLWTCLSKGTRSSPGNKSENSHLREESLRAAIANIDLSCLPDGRSVKSFQANNDFNGLRSHAGYLARLKREKQQVEARPPEVEEESAIDPESAEQGNSPDAMLGGREEDELRKRKCALLKAELLRRVGEQWIMTHRIHLTSGATMDAVILEARAASLRLRIPAGIVSIPKAQIKFIEPYENDKLAETISELLAKEDLAYEWQSRVRDEVVRELSERCIQYGPYLPGLWVVEMKRNKKTGELEAVVKREKTRTTVRKGGQVEGFKIIGMDIETSSILVMMGEGGEVLRIWPEPRAPELS